MPLGLLTETKTLKNLEDRPECVVNIPSPTVDIHVRRDFIMKENYIDPEKWQPLIYNSRHHFGLSEELGSTFRAKI